MRASLLLAATGLLCPVVFAAPIDSGGTQSLDGSIPGGEDQLDVVNADFLGALIDAYYLQEAVVNPNDVLDDVNLMIADSGIDPNQYGDIPDEEEPDEEEPAAAEPAADTSGDIPDTVFMTTHVDASSVDTSMHDTSATEDVTGVIDSAKRQQEEEEEEEALSQFEDFFSLAFVDGDGDGDIPVIDEKPMTEEEQAEAVEEVIKRRRQLTIIERDSVIEDAVKSWKAQCQKVDCNKEDVKPDLMKCVMSANRWKFHYQSMTEQSIIYENMPSECRDLVKEWNDMRGDAPRETDETKINLLDGSRFELMDDPEED